MSIDYLTATEIESKTVLRATLEPNFDLTMQSRKYKVHCQNAFSFLVRQIAEVFR